ncbi:rhodanese-related sulfurtransferase [Aquiluna sp.]|nr:rhodanese-related sulfurtransferase [Aquiluna sp.]
MAINKIILYYGFTPVADPKAVMLWQKTLCDALNLKGRILISKHGINGTLGGDIADLRKYARQTKEYPGFGKIDFKWSDGQGDDFPKLSVKVKKELVAFTTPDEVTVEKSGITNGGKHLKPHQVNELVEKHGDDVVFFDGRNAYEAKIGKFKNAIVPDVQTTHEFVAELESGKYDHLKDKQIVTYCTGGIRCEILSAVMLNRGFKEVYQIEGGIVRYGEKFRDRGLWEGALYVFDKRMIHRFSDEAKTIGECEVCIGPTSDLRDCLGLGCKDLVLLCDSCFEDPENLKCNESHVRGRKKLQEIG